MSIDKTAFRNDMEALARRASAAASGSVEVIACIRGPEVYAFLFTAPQRSQAIHAISDAALNPELSFSWFDADVLIQRIRPAMADEHGGL